MEDQKAWRPVGQCAHVRHMSMRNLRDYAECLLAAWDQRVLLTHPEWIDVKICNGSRWACIWFWAGPRGCCGAWMSKLLDMGYSAPLAIYFGPGQEAVAGGQAAHITGYCTWTRIHRSFEIWIHIYIYWEGKTVNSYIWIYINMNWNNMN